MTPSVAPDFDEKPPSGETLSHIFHLLQSERRRRVIWYLTHLKSNETVTVRRLAKNVASAEQNMPIPEIPNEDYRPVYTNLVQHHLPALADADAIDFNADRKVVTPGQNLNALSVVAGITIPVIALLRSETVNK
ncbi:DUF7344 domain-containing protein [Natranaeroarchaeum aerophilus]|uniref:DUF7344 domain-containing protein n=1 Tax=Natranaeroarchaeum aerophilus TaxID=2917711 RepID=A0AAE3FTF8_9EURY|nr:hypothetical protein [Natranaeroarchaeum aerophilus]MCL9815287.1 hypothetical protein [Natranaeroarchaeum aerophilus]